MDVYNCLFRDTLYVKKTEMSLKLEFETILMSKQVFESNLFSKDFQT